MPTRRSAHGPGPATVSVPTRQAASRETAGDDASSLRVGRGSSPPRSGTVVLLLVPVRHSLSSRVALLASARAVRASSAHGAWVCDSM